MARGRRLAAGALALAGLAAAALLSALLWYRQASLPVHEGTLRVPGLVEAVQVRRDEAGVPHIHAAHEHDALFALGFSHAQDRLWQMDFNRRIAHGRLAELVGPAGLEVDRFIRTMGVPQIARQMAQDLDAATRGRAQAYVAGVNAQLTARSGPLPPEFWLTRAPAPAPWTIEDSLGWAVVMALDLGQTWRDELARLLLAARFSKAEIDDLRPEPNGGAPPLDADYVDTYRLLGLFAPRTALLEQATRLAALPSLGGLGVGAGLGSNNWVVAGARSTSGAPLLANDPHLGLTTPGVFYFASLQVSGAAGFRVFGATVPGLPFVLLGRNEHVAWGFANTEADAEDLYIERLHPTDPTQVQTPAGFAPFALREEVIRVKGQGEVRFTVRATRHGPVVSDVLPALQPAAAGASPQKAASALRERPRLAGSHVLSLRIAAALPGDTSLRAFAAMIRARNAAELQAALRDLTLLRQNVVFAERPVQPGAPATIGLQVVGRVPLRAADNELRGVVPSPGWEPRYDWRGVVPFDELPRVIDPPAGFIATANHKVATRPYPLHIGTTYAPPYRIERIQALLAAQPRHDVRSLQAIQLDQTSLAARALLPLLSRAQPASEAARVALGRLAQWDGSLRADAPEGLLLHAWLRELRQRIFQDDLGEPLPVRSEMTVSLVRVLQGQAGARDWCNDRGTQRRETCAEQLTESLEAAVRDLAQSTGRDVLGLRWGEQHPAVLEHRPLSQVPVLRRWFEHRLPVGGDANTVNVAAVGRAPDAPFAAVHGPVMRLVADLSGPGGAWISLTPQDGHPLADDDTDLAVDWQRGRYRPIDFDARPRHVLHLQPQK
ncbi:MAG: penicillin acylase family protein [Betaproteobacteria bacterium]